MGTTPASLGARRSLAEAVEGEKDLETPERTRSGVVVLRLEVLDEGREIVHGRRGRT
jgi:hypothetical protein